MDFLGFFFFYGPIFLVHNFSKDGIFFFREGGWGVRLSSCQFITTTQLHVLIMSIFYVFFFFGSLARQKKQAPSCPLGVSVRCVSAFDSTLLVKKYFRYRLITNFFFLFL